MARVGGDEFLQSLAFELGRSVPVEALPREEILAGNVAAAVFQVTAEGVVAAAQPLVEVHIVLWVVGDDGDMGAGPAVVQLGGGALSKSCMINFIQTLTLGDLVIVVIAEDPGEAQYDSQQ